MTSKTPKTLQINGEPYAHVSYVENLASRFASANRELSQLRAEVEGLRADKERLDWLDKNLSMRMEWRFSIAHAGNICCTPTICLGDKPLKGIRENIDAAIHEAKEKA